jgi:hypothetical protein
MAKRLTFGTGTATRPPEKPRELLSGRLGLDVDQFDRRLRPGTKIHYWAGDGRGNYRVHHGFLSDQLSDGTWTIHYFQRGRLSYAVTIKFSERPKSHHWTVEEVYDAWRDGKVKADD